MTNAESVCGSCDCADPTTMPELRRECACGCHGRRTKAAKSATNKSSKPTHTPGPWTYQGEPEGYRGSTIICPDSNSGMPIIAALDIENDESAANARLIAAAPDLLNAALLAQAVIVDGPMTEMARVELRAKARRALFDAIAKATANQEVR